MAERGCAKLVEVLLCVDLEDPWWLSMLRGSITRFRFAIAAVARSESN
jgi:hypothetical protein